MEISVIITNYNYEKFVARAIRSVINQSFNKNEYEIIVIDDCSTDGSKTIIDSFSGHVKPIYNTKNIGLSASCNVAIRSALGKYIIRVDADDFVVTDFLKVHQLFLAHNKDYINATSCDYYEVDINEDILTRRNGDTFPIACGVMYKADDIIRLGLYDESLPREDIEFRKRFLQSGRHIYNISIPLYRYTQHLASKTKNYGAGPKKLKPTYKISDQIQFANDIVGAYKRLGHRPEVISLPEAVRTNGAKDLIIVDVR